MVTVPETFTDFCASMSEAEDENAREMLERLAGKWPLAVMQVLAEAGGPLRFSRVLERAGGVSQKVLTQALRMLEREGFVKRTLYPQVPPRVEYELTTLGYEFMHQIVPLWRWIVQRLPEIERSRVASEEDAARLEAAADRPFTG